MTRSGSRVRYRHLLSVAIATSLVLGVVPAAGVLLAHAQGRAYSAVSGVTGGSGGGGTSDLTLTPATAANPVDTSHSVTARVANGVGGAAVAGVPVSFRVAGVNSLVSPGGGTCTRASCITDASGKVTFTYFDANGGGTDSITATATISVCEDSTGTIILGVDLSDMACVFLRGTNIRTTEGASASKTWIPACGDDTAAPLDAHGMPILPTGATDPVTASVVNRPDGSVDQLYPLQDTTTDLWYPNVPCDWSIGGTLPPASQLDPGITTALTQLGLTTTPTQLTTQLGHIASHIAATATPLPPGTILPPICPPKGATSTGNGPKGPTARACGVTGGAPPLNPALPFGGRDLIFVGGFQTQPFQDIADNIHVPKWPAEPSGFYAGGYWKAIFDDWWANHIGHYLHGEYPGGTPSTSATNRYLTVAWPTTQRLFVGAHAMLTQIAQAMSPTATGVQPTTSGGNTSGFCENGCVIISHSTGGPLTDVAMDLAKRTMVTGSSYQNAYGNLGFISLHVRAHIALHGAFAGSGLATAAFLLAEGGSIVEGLCKIAAGAINLFGGNTSCNVLGRLTQTIRTSVLVDLIPLVMQVLWRGWIKNTPVPTLTVAGGNPHADGIDVSVSGNAILSPIIKVLLLPGFDDGVLPMNSQCANPNPSGIWPTVLRQSSSYIPYTPFFLIRTFDMGVPADRSIPFWLAQNVDPAVSIPHLPISAACTRYVAPDGMVQPAGLSLPAESPFNRYMNHYSFLQSVSDHYIGPVDNNQEAAAPYYTNCYLASDMYNHNCEGSVSAPSLNDNTEEVRVITNAAVYTPPPTCTGSGASLPPLCCPTAGGALCAPLVDPSFGAQGMVQQFTRGKSITFKLFGHTHRWWIWKRTYTLLTNSATWQEDDYVYNYVLK